MAIIIGRNPAHHLINGLINECGRFNRTRKARIILADFKNIGVARYSPERIISIINRERQWHITPRPCEILLQRFPLSISFWIND